MISSKDLENLDFIEAYIACNPVVSKIKIPKSFKGDDHLLLNFVDLMGLDEASVNEDDPELDRLTQPRQYNAKDKQYLQKLIHYHTHQHPQFENFFKTFQREILLNEVEVEQNPIFNPIVMSCKINYSIDEAVLDITGVFNDLGNPGFQCINFLKFPLLGKKIIIVNELPRNSTKTYFFSRRAL